MKQFLSKKPILFACVGLFLVGFASFLRSKAEYIGNNTSRNYIYGSTEKNVFENTDQLGFENNNQYLMQSPYESDATTTTILQHTSNQNVPRDDIYTQYELNENAGARTESNKKVSKERIIITSAEIIGKEPVVNRVQSLTERKIVETMGISFLIDPFWTVTSNNTSVIIKQVGPTTKDMIVMTRFKGTSVTTKDALFGNNTYYYDTEENSWIRVLHRKPTYINQEYISLKVNPVSKTKYQDAIFEGTTRYKTYIVAFGKEDFLIVNIRGTGHTAILNSFVYEIQNIE